MSETINRHIQIDDWIFEIKMVRALRVKRYGEPYSAIANICLNGNDAYIDGVMQKNQQSLNIKDIQTLKEFCDKMNIENMQFEQQQSPVELQSVPSKILSFG
jgi:hypothetical protein